MKIITIKQLKRISFWNTVKYYLYYAPIRYLDMLPRRIYWFFQRGYRGYGDNDIWDFDFYLAKIISQGLKEFKKYYHGKLPSKKDLDIIIKGFEANIKMMEGNVSSNSKEHVILKLKFIRGIEKLKEHFNNLWD
jgi:hypothetical protein